MQETVDRKEAVIETHKDHENGAECLQRGLRFDFYYLNIFFF